MDDLKCLRQAQADNKVDLPANTLYFWSNLPVLSLAFYNLFLFLYGTGIRVAALFNPKAKLWIKGRKDGFSIINSTLSGNSSPVIWMHCASLGEFEQGRPVLESLKNEYPSHKIALTFFSPSGYEIRKNYAGADWVFYLPMDGAGNAKKFIDIINPSLVIWVKYEYWYYYLTQLKKKNIPVLLVSGIFRSSQPFFKWYGGIWKKMLAAFDHLFVQTAHSAELLAQLHISSNVTVSGDTRFDRVIDIAENFSPLPQSIIDFCGDHKVIVAGSTWEDDEAEWYHYIKTHPEIRYILAPHEVDAENIKNVQQELPAAILYSEMNKKGFQPDEHINLLIIDNIGMLAKLYHYAAITYVGGGFNDSGIHNVLEAAVYGRPVIFGPVYEKFAEAKGLVECGGAFSIESAVELDALLNELLGDAQKLADSSKAAKDFVYSHRGATKKIVEYIKDKQLGKS
jgi:3-deoxy-D-manno-octulosonic-acid transferase